MFLQVDNLRAEGLEDVNPSPLCKWGEQLKDAKLAGCNLLGPRKKVITFYFDIYVNSW